MCEKIRTKRIFNGSIAKKLIQQGFNPKFEPNKYNSSKIVFIFEASNEFIKAFSLIMEELEQSRQKQVV